MKHSAGKILELDEERLYIACSDSIISIDGLMNDDKDGLTPLDVSRVLNLKKGDIIL